MLGSRHRRSRLTRLALTVVPAIALAGCGTTEIDPSKAAHLIREELAGGVSVKYIHCPSGITAKAGTSFNCNVSLERDSNHTVYTGTVTVHVTSSSGSATVRSSDFHLQ